MPTKPTTLDEFFRFYHEYVKLLYSSVQTRNALPVETLFELNAALDHISRHWAYNESEAEVVEKAFAHLKRSCLDIFRLKVKEAREQYEELRQLDTSIIDNGEYDAKLLKLGHEIRCRATDARRFEGKHIDDMGRAFERWEGVYELCVQLETEFYLHPHLDWAKRKNTRITIREVVLGAIGFWLLGIVTPTFSTAWRFLVACCKFVAKLFNR